jgi:tetratricopeptide (TPR) repeat protein
MIFRGAAMASGSRLLVQTALLASFVLPNSLHAQLGVVGKIIGNVKVSRGDFPDHPVLVSVETRGSVISSAYTDGQGRFGFYNLIANPYRITIDDEAFEPFSVNVDLNPDSSPVNFVQVTLVPRSKGQKDPLLGRTAGSNPALIDSTEYNRQFPKKTLKEFERGVEADHKGKPDEAIQHYQKSLSYSPEFYPAHNNLGSVYLNRKNFEAAQTEFETALKLNRSDANAYFNLANVCLLQARLPDAERFLDEGLRRQPESAMGKFLLGSLNIRNGKLPEAELALQQAVKLDPTLAQPRLQLVNLLLKEGRKADAEEQIRSFLTALPDSPFSSHAKQLLQRLETAATTPAVATSPSPPN